MKKFIEWLEEDNKRLRKVLAIVTGIVWIVMTIVAFGFIYVGKDILAVYSLVTAQFATVVTAYMATKADND